MLFWVAVAALLPALAAAQCAYSSSQGLPVKLGTCFGGGSMAVSWTCTGMDTNLTQRAYSTPTCDMGTNILTQNIPIAALPPDAVECNTGMPCGNVTFTSYLNPPNCATGAPNATTLRIATLAEGQCSEFGQAAYVTWLCNATGATMRFFSDDMCSTPTTSYFIQPGCNDNLPQADGTTTSAFFEKLCGITLRPTTAQPSTAPPSTQPPSTMMPSMSPTPPTTTAPSTASPSTQLPTTMMPSTSSPSTQSPTTMAPSTLSPTGAPSTLPPTPPTTATPTTASPTTPAPVTPAPVAATPAPSGALSVHLVWAAVAAVVGIAA